MKYFVALQQCKAIPLLHFHGHTEHFYIVNSHIYANNKKKITYCCFHGNSGYANMPQCNGIHTMNVTLYIHCLSCCLLGSPSLIFTATQILCVNVTKFHSHLMANRETSPLSTCAWDGHLQV